MMKFYRYEIIQYASLDTDGEYGNSLRNRFPIPSLICHSYNLFKETPKGYWIGSGYLNDGLLRDEGRWVSKTAKKRYAYPTKGEALINFIKRTEKRKNILEYQSLSCKLALELAKKEKTLINEKM